MLALGSAMAWAAPADPGLPDLGPPAPPAEARGKSYAIPAAEIAVKRVFADAAENIVYLEVTKA